MRRIFLNRVFLSMSVVLIVLGLSLADTNPPPKPSVKPPDVPKSIVIQLLVMKDSHIWMDGKRITLEDVNRLKAGDYTVDDVRGSQGVLTYLGLYSTKDGQPPPKGK